jgi:hypothetical protein
MVTAPQRSLKVFEINSKKQMITRTPMSLSVKKNWSAIASAITYKNS